MSRARHSKGHKEHEKHRAAGGETEVGNPHVFKIAKEGTVGTIHGEKGKERLDRKRGGKVHHRADGGKAGSDTHPYTSAHKHGGEVKGHSFDHGLHGFEKKELPHGGRK